MRTTPPSRRIAETGGFKPDDEWDARLAKTKAFADFTVALGVKLLACHIGFVPHDTADPQYAVMVDRLKQVCDVLGRARPDAGHGDRPGEGRGPDASSSPPSAAHNIAVNFDPANMILYGVGDPVEAIAMLQDKIVHCHMKDADLVRSARRRPGARKSSSAPARPTSPAWSSKLRAIGYQGPLVIEREAGDQRVADIKTAIQLLEKVVG